MHQPVKELLASAGTIPKIQLGQYPSPDGGTTQCFGKSLLVAGTLEQWWDNFLFQFSIISYHGLTV